MTKAEESNNEEDETLFPEDKSLSEEEEDALEMLRQDEKEELLRQQDESGPPPEVYDETEDFIPEDDGFISEEEIEPLEEPEEQKDDFFSHKSSEEKVIILKKFIDSDPQLAGWKTRIIEQLQTRVPRDDILVNLKSFILDCHQFIAINDTNEVLYYSPEENKWMFGAENLIRRLIQAVSSSFKKSDKDEVIDKVRCAEHNNRSIYKNRSILNPRHLIGVKNGAIRLSKAGITFEPHSPEHYLTKQIPVDYNPDIYPEKVIKFLGEIVDPRDIPLLVQMIGYCLHSEYIYHKFFILNGEGANGKSTFINLLISFLGKENIASSSMQALEQSEYSRAKLYGKMANLCADIPKSPIENTDIIKSLTGNDIIEAREIYKQPIEFHNTAKLIFSCNILPPFYNDRSFALKRRRCLIDFPLEFVGDKCDKQIFNKLTTPTELSGLLNVALWGLVQLLMNRGFQLDDKVEEIDFAYTVKSDSIRGFAMVILEADPDEKVLASTVNRYYRKWCDFNNLHPKGTTKFNKYLPNCVEEAERKRVTVNKVREYYWVGIKIKPNMKKLLDY